MKFVRFISRGKLVAGKLVLDNPRWFRTILSKYDDTDKISITIEKVTSKRTERQNRAMHIFFTLLAKEMNDGGLPVQLVLKEKMEIDWTPRLVKELLWRDAQKAILDKKSTTELSKTEDIDKVYDHLVRHLGEKFSIEVPVWPHFETEEEYVEATT